MGDCQKSGPFLGPCYNTGPNTGPNLGDPKKDQNFDNPPSGTHGRTLLLWRRVCLSGGSHGIYSSFSKSIIDALPG